MRLIKESLAVLGALCLLAGCSTDLDIKKLGDPSSYEAPAALSPSSIHLTAADVSEDKLVTFTWSAADYGQPTEIVYSIFVTYGGKTTALFTNLKGTSYDAKSSELYQKLTGSGICRYHDLIDHRLGFLLTGVSGKDHLCLHGRYPDGIAFHT